VAVLSSIADPVVVQGIPVQPAPAVVSGAASPHGTEPLVSELDVRAFLRKVGCDLSALRDNTFICWSWKGIDDDDDCRVIAHLALPASAQSPSMGALGKLTSLRCAPAPPHPKSKCTCFVVSGGGRGHP
jgi:hypothetical protein